MFVRKPRPHERPYEDIPADNSSQCPRRQTATTSTHVNEQVSNEPSPKPLALPAESLDTQEQKEATFIVLHQIPDPQIP